MWTSDAEWKKKTNSHNQHNYTTDISVYSSCQIINPNNNFSIKRDTLNIITYT